MRLAIPASYTHFHMPLHQLVIFFKLQGLNALVLFIVVKLITLDIFIEIKLYLKEVNKIMLIKT